jgi:hypothetical protein
MVLIFSTHQRKDPKHLRSIIIAVTGLYTSQLIVFEAKRQLWQAHVLDMITSTSPK